MGCNTSKESVQPAAEEAKEEAENGDIPKLAEDCSKESEQQKEDNKEPSDKEKEKAATRIQAAFRGHYTRKSMKEAGAPSKQSVTKAEPEPTKEQLQEEFRADDKELCNAATKIQASFRGHMSRKEQAALALAESAKDIVDNVATKVEEKVDDALNELEGIDLSDPDLHKAATKIQASFRGHKARQEVGDALPTGAQEAKK